MSLPLPGTGFTITTIVVQRYFGGKKCLVWGCIAIFHLQGSGKVELWNKKSPLLAQCMNIKCSKESVKPVPPPRPPVFLPLLPHNPRRYRQRRQRASLPARSGPSGTPATYAPPPAPSSLATAPPRSPVSAPWQSPRPAQGCPACRGRRGRTTMGTALATAISEDFQVTSSFSE